MATARVCMSQTQTARSFEVRELGVGASNVPFHYRIMLRKNFESIRLENHTNDPDSTQNPPLLFAYLIRGSPDRPNQSGREDCNVSHYSFMAQNPRQHRVRWYF